MKKWIVCADRVGAVVYDWKRGEGSLQEIARFSHPEGALDDKSLVSDKAGRMLNRGDGARQAYAPKHEATEIEFQKFARQIGTYLESAGYKKEFDRLVLAAEPRTLGILKQELGLHANGGSTEFLNNELTHFKLAELKEYLNSHNL